MNCTDQIADLYSQLPRMPEVSKTRIKIPEMPYGQLPKDLEHPLSRKMNRFLNKNLSVIEEIRHRDRTNPIPKWFIEYQLEYFKKYGILEHDNIFSSHLRDGYRLKINPNFAEIREVGRMGALRGYFIEFGKVNGATLTCGGTSSSSSYGGVLSLGTATGVSGTYYNSIGVNVHSLGTNKNLHLGCYDNSASQVLYVDSGAKSVSSTGFNDFSVTEFALTDTSPWFGLDAQNDDTLYKRTTTDARHVKLVTYGALPNPFSGYTSDSNGVNNSRISHS